MTTAQSSIQQRWRRQIPDPSNAGSRLQAPGSRLQALGSSSLASLVYATLSASFMQNPRSSWQPPEISFSLPCPGPDLLISAASGSVAQFEWETPTSVWRPEASARQSQS